MEALIVSHTTSLRGIRAARRMYAAVPWTLLSKVQQNRILKSCLMPATPIDFDFVERMGFWENNSSEQLDMLIGMESQRRRDSRICSHLISSLPPGAIMHVAHDLYSCSPAFTALLCSKGKSVGEIIPLLMELLGTYMLPEEATLPISRGDAWRRNGLVADPQPDDPTMHSAAGSMALPVQQAHYHCNPAVTVEELRAMTAWATSSRYATFRAAVKYVASGSASPAESIMFGMFALPQRYGGFNMLSLPKGGILLNHRVDFDEQALHMSSGIPYAILDAYIPAANMELEYNGIGHEEQAARIHDGQRNNGVRGMGIAAIVINRDQMRDVVALEAIARTIYRSAGKCLRYRTDGYRKQQHALLNTLRKAIGLPPC